ncbi:MAG: heparinase II/III family protein [Phycisphaerae bacterium]
MASDVHAENAAKPAPSATKVLKSLQQEHPRLLLTDDRLAELKKQAGSDKLLQQAVKDSIAQADKLLKAPPLEHKLKGPRLLSVSRECRKRVYALGLAYRWTGEKKYLEAMKSNLLTVCAFPDWNPSHFLDTAEMANAVGIGYDWAYKELSGAERKTIRRGLVKLGLEEGRKAYTGKTAWWVRSAFNWNQVCNAGLSIGALAVADEEPQLAGLIVSSAVKSLPTALKTYDPDGAWGEGPSYWNYATRYTVYGLSAMRTALGTDFGLSDREGLREAGMFPYYLTKPTGYYVSYADANMDSKRHTLPPALWLARRYDMPDLAAMELLAMKKHGADPLHVIWFPKKPTIKFKQLALDRLFDGVVPVAVFRESWTDPNASFAAIKAGYNRVNHGHLDLGTFEFDTLGKRWAVDPGKDYYNLPGYWDGNTNTGKRWTYFRLNSKSHNVPLIDGRNQDVAGKAKFIGYRGGKSQPHAVVDLTSAYPQAKRVQRGIMLYDQRNALLIRDEFELAGKHDITWGMTTPAKIHLSTDKNGGSAGKLPNVKLTPNRALLENDGQFVLAEITAPAGARFVSRSAEQKDPQARNKGLRRLEIDLPDRSGSVAIIVTLAPVVETRSADCPTPGPLRAWTKDKATDEDRSRQ